jgi:hypothetical protein
LNFDGNVLSNAAITPHAAPLLALPLNGGFILDWLYQGVFIE